MTFINGLIALAGAFIYYVFKNNLKKILIFLVSFAAGALIGGALFHFIPEAIEKIRLPYTIIITMFGFVIFFALEKVVHWHHCHDRKCNKHAYPYLLLWGDGIHNFIDGLIIAGSFLASIPFGIISSLLIMIHELPQEIGDFGVLVYGGLESKKALIYNFFSQLTAVLGGVIGFFFLGIKDLSIYLLPFAGGGFMYIAFADLIPEVFKEKNIIRLIVNILFIILGLFILISGKILVG